MDSEINLESQRCSVLELSIKGVTRKHIYSHASQLGITAEQALDSIVQEWIQLKYGRGSCNDKSTFDSDALVERLELLTAQSQQLYEDTAELYQRMKVQFPPF